MSKHKISHCYVFGNILRLMTPLVSILFHPVYQLYTRRRSVNSGESYIFSNCNHHSLGCSSNSAQRNQTFSVFNQRHTHTSDIWKTFHKLKLDIFQETATYFFRELLKNIFIQYENYFNFFAHTKWVNATQTFWKKDKAINTGDWNFRLKIRKPVVKIGVNQGCRRKPDRFVSFRFFMKTSKNSVSFFGSLLSSGSGASRHRM